MMATVASRSIMEGWLTPSALGRCLAELLGGRCAPRQVGVASGGALLQRLAAVRGRLSLCADQAAAAKWWLSMPMASVSAEGRSEEHTSELQSLMRISYAVFCLKKKTKTRHA